ncbi:MAG: SpoIIE family protein phosphatase [Flavobacteriales bacterium]|nr:SpoIIE family protein phosphatase [Flavobacteriales bacterium]
MTEKNLFSKKDVRVNTVQNKIIAVTVGIVLIFSPFLFYYFPNKQKNLLITEYKKKVSNIATTVALGVNISLQEKSFQGVETSMQHAKSDKRLAFVALVQIDSTFSEDGKLTLEKSEFSIYPQDYDFDMETKTSDSIIVSKAVLDTEFLSGEVVVGFSSQYINDTIAGFILESFIGSLLLSLLGIGMGVYLARTISKPILMLKKANQLVEGGDLLQYVQIERKDEIGDLSESFNSMVRQLDKTEKKLKHQKALVEEKNRDMVDSIVYAKEIQEAILPSVYELHECFTDKFVLYMPKDIVSGDFYWMQKAGGKTLISVADCTGHGVPGAFVSLVSCNALNSSVKEHGLTQPAEILNKTNSIIRDQFDKNEEGAEMRDGMDLALCSIIKGATSIEYAGALNALWIISSKTPIDNGVEMEVNISESGCNLFEVKADKQPIGRHIKQNPYTNHKLDLNKGDVIYMFSDGFADQFGGERGKKLKSKVFKKHLIKIWNKPLKKQGQILQDLINNWMGDNEQIDDICVIGIRI